MEKDVHTEHCCKSHGCKYSDPYCTVAHGDKEQSYPCETCDEEEDNELIKLMKWLSEQEYLTDYTQEKTNWEKIYQQYLEPKMTIYIVTWSRWEEEGIDSVFLKKEDAEKRVETANKNKSHREYKVEPKYIYNSFEEFKDKNG